MPAPSRDRCHAHGYSRFYSIVHIQAGKAIVRRLARALVMIVVSGMIVPLGANAGVARTDTFFPVLGPAVASDDWAGGITLNGTGFAPGGMVFIAIHDQWGNTQHETRWITASEISYQPPQDLPPGESFSFDTGGNFAETFQIEIGTTAVPDGSQNPALGPVTSQPTTMPGVSCAHSLMVMAYDRSSATWSNAVEVELGCAG